MTDSDAEMIASLKGFTPGPWERDGICVSQMSRPPTEICLMGNPPQYPGDTGGMMVNSMHNAALIAAAPDLHRIATEQAAEIARLQALLENAIDHHYAAMCVVRGNLDDSYKPMAEGMKSACNRWRSALPNSSLRGHYE